MMFRLAGQNPTRISNPLTIKMGVSGDATVPSLAELSLQELSEKVSRKILEG